MLPQQPSINLTPGPLSSEVVVPTGDATRDSANIQRALDGAQGAVWLAPGTFVLQRGVVVPIGKWLWGSANAILQRQPQVSTTTDTDIFNGVTTQIVVLSATGFKVGDDIGLESAGTVSSGTSMVTAIDGNTVTVSPAFALPVASIVANGISVFTSSNLVHLRNNTTVYGISFDGNAANNPIGFWQTTSSIEFGSIAGPDAADNARAYNCRVSNEAGEGFISDGADNIVIEDCVFSTIDGNGIHLGGTNGGIIRGCSFTATNQRVAVGHADGCISFSNNVSEIVIEGCHFANSPLAGIGGFDSIQNDHLTVIGCDFISIVTTPIDGVFPLNDAPSDLLVQDCTFQSCGTFALNQVAASTTNPRRLVVDTCIFTDTNVQFTRIFDSKFTNNTLVSTSTTTAVLSINGCNNCDFSGNKISGGLVAIDFSNSAGASSNLRVDGNTIRDFLGASGVGIRLQSTFAGVVSVSHNTIVQDVVVGGGIYGIFIPNTPTGDSLLLDGNRISLAAGVGAQQYGIDSLATNTRSTIINNKVLNGNTGANGRGIRVNSNDRVKNNEVIQPTAGIPIEIVGAALVPIVQDNIAVRVAGQTAIQVTTATSAARVFNNQYLGNFVNNSGGTAIFTPVGTGTNDALP